MKLATVSISFFAIAWFGRTAAASVPQPPPGWKMELVASAPTLRHPTVVCCAPDGRVFVAEDPMDISTPHADAMEGRILCFRPDGSHTVFAEHLHAVFGMQYIEGKLYVLHNPQFKVFSETNGVVTGRSNLIESVNPNPWALDWNDHVPANFKLAMDGYLYVATGDKGVFGAVGRDGKRLDMHSGGLLRLRPDGTGLEIYSSGVRNILDVALTDEDEMFTYDNTDEHDWMGRLTHMVDGGFYGYPHDFVPRRPYTLWMMHDFGGGAACDTLCYTEDALPGEYHENLFLADFGKRQVLRVRIERAADTFRVVDWDEFFPKPPNDFRPVGLAWGADGLSFYICDWQHADTKESVVVGRLWKASWTGPNNAKPKPAWYLGAMMGQPTRPAEKELLKALAHASKNVRLAAQRLLSERKATAGLTKVVLDSGAAPRARWHAIWALDAIDEGRAGRRTILRAALDDRDERVRRQAIRQLGLRRAPEALDALLPGLKERNAAVRFQAVTALGRVGSARSISALSEVLNETNLFTRFAAFTALNRIGRAKSANWVEVVHGLESERAAVREGTGFALRDTYDSALIEALVKLANRQAARVEAREAAVQILSALSLRLPPWKGEWWAYHPALTPAPQPSESWEGTEQVRAALDRLINDAESRVRLAAVQGLQIARASNSAPTLRAQFGRETHSEIRVAILEALGQFRDAAFSAQLSALLQETEVEESVRLAAIRTARQLDGPELRKVLLDLAGAERVGETIRVSAIEALGELKAAEALPVLGGLLRDSSAALRRSAERAIARIGGAEALDLLRGLLADPARRREAVTSIGLLRDKAAVPDLMGAWKEAAIRDAALAGLASISDPRALEAYLAGVAGSDVLLREECMKALRPIREEVLPQIEAQAASLPPEVVRRLRTLYEDVPRATNGPLFAAHLQVPEAADYEQYAANHPGNAALGQRIFFDERGAACIKCHAVSGYGGTVGPDLTLIGLQFPRATLVESVLYPSRVVREGYQQTVLELRDGESVAGVLKTETAAEVTMVDASARPVAIPKSSIQKRATSQLSVMPEGLQSGLTLEQFVNVIAFLESRRLDPRQPGKGAVPAGYRVLFNGRNLAGWREVPEGTKRVQKAEGISGSEPRHWKAINGVFEHDGVASDLWTEAEFGDFDLRLEWRWADAPVWADFPLINRDGLEQTGADGRAITERVLDAGDSGVLLRGLYKAQPNLFCYPIGSGELWEYRTDPATNAEGRRSFTPARAADRPIGDWNEMEIKLRGNVLTVVLNGEAVITGATLPGLPDRGPIGLQHEHGRIQFRNVAIK